MPHSDAELDAAIAALTQPGALAAAQAVVAARAPQLQGILDQALGEADWWGSASESALLRAAGTADPDERVLAVRRLVEEETRLSMLIGVAVGYALARRLEGGPGQERPVANTREGGG